MKDIAEVKLESTPSVPMRLDPQELIKTALEKDASIETLERLFALAKDLRAQQAKEAWHVAMAQFQERCPIILKSETATIATRSGGRFSYSYAPLGELTSTIVPVLGPLGLSISYRVRHDKDQVIAVCRISHELGHYEESGEVAMPIVRETETGQGAMGANPAQRVGIASTYAKRYALLAITGLAPEDDPDSKPENGKPAVSMPRRESEKGSAAAAPAAERNVWVGKILDIKERPGEKQIKEKDGSTRTQKWMLYIIQTKDAQEFVTFSKIDADFARNAGASTVQIVWEKSDRGGQKIVSIGPLEEEPGA